VAVSGIYGKIFLHQTTTTVNKNVFNTFIEEWHKNHLIPYDIRTKGPFLILDSLSVNISSDLSNMDHKFLPRYSPFLNLAEPEPIGFTKKNSSDAKNLPAQNNINRKTTIWNQGLPKECIIITRNRT